MKNKIILFLLFLVSFANASESIDSTFKKANDLYNKGDYEQAVQSFESIVNQGNESADLYFNIANCYYKLGKVAPSIYNYEKALLLNPDDEAIQTNLSFAQKKAAFHEEMPPIIFSLRLCLCRGILRRCTRLYRRVPTGI